MSGMRWFGRLRLVHKVVISLEESASKMGSVLHEVDTPRSVAQLAAYPEERRQKNA
jgi:hypothetical protein